MYSTREVSMIAGQMESMAVYQWNKSTYWILKNNRMGWLGRGLLQPRPRGGNTVTFSLATILCINLSLFPTNS